MAQTRAVVAPDGRPQRRVDRCGILGFSARAAAVATTVGAVTITGGGCGEPNRTAPRCGSCTGGLGHAVAVIAAVRANPQIVAGPSAAAAATMKTGHGDIMTDVPLSSPATCGRTPGTRHLLRHLAPAIWSVARSGEGGGSWRTVGRPRPTTTTTSPRQRLLGSTLGCVIRWDGALDERHGGPTLSLRAGMPRRRSGSIGRQWPRGVIMSVATSGSARPYPRTEVSTAVAAHASAVWFDSQPTT